MITQDLNLSYWEFRQYFRRFDLIVIGGGIVGLNAALAFAERNPGASILVLERGWLPNGASSKNAGFACFGTAGELLDDLATISADIVWETVRMRWEGLLLLRRIAGDKAIDLQKKGGYELFNNDEEFAAVSDRLAELNEGILFATGLRNCFQQPRTKQQFSNFTGQIFNRHEAQIDTGRMMHRLTSLASARGITMLNNVKVSAISDGATVTIDSDKGEFSAGRVVVATNGFASQLLEMNDVRPARAQVLITTPIDSNPVNGTYHIDKGYYYFRDVHGRVLLGGGRNLDLSGEQTFDNSLNPVIQSTLETMLREMILPGINFRIERRWTGIMGMGKEKKPIIRNFSRNVVAAVRMGGMGIAIGSLVGRKAAELAS